MHGEALWTTGWQIHGGTRHHKSPTVCILLLQLPMRKRWASFIFDTGCIFMWQCPEFLLVVLMCLKNGNIIRCQTPIKVMWLASRLARVICGNIGEECVDLIKISLSRLHDTRLLLSSDYVRWNCLRQVLYG